MSTSKMFIRMYKMKKKPLLLAANLFFISFVLVLFYEVTVIGRQKFQDIVNEAVVTRRGVRGMHPKLEGFYRQRRTFRCVYTKELIVSSKVNDDYCDCTDGTDEPGTNACVDSYFFCDVENEFGRFQLNHVILSSRVNDGICDCCDGSDEYGLMNPHEASNSTWISTLVTCPYRC